MRAAQATRRPRGGLWRHRDFRVFWLGETTSLVGTAVASIALPLVAIDRLHASALVVTALTAGTWLPWLAIGLPAGAWVDRLPRRPVMLVADAVSLGAFLSVPVAAWLGVLTVAQLLAVALLDGAAAVFFKTAYAVLIPAIVGESDLTEANAKLTGSASAAQIGGPGLGGAIVALAGAASGLLADALSFAVSFACLSAIRPDDPVPNRPSDRQLLHEMRTGCALVLGDPLLRTMVAFSAAVNFFLTGMNALEVVFLVRTVGIGPGAVGVVLAAVSAGGLVGAIVARSLSARLGSARAALTSIVCSLPFALLLPLTTRGAGLSLWIGGLLVVDGGVAISNVLTGSFFQSYVPREMLGRARAFLSTAAYSMMPAGALVAGALATGLGVRAAMWVLCAGIAASLVVALASPIRRLRDFPSAPPIHREPAPAT